MAEAQTKPWLTEHGDKTGPQHEILRTVVGSEVHGIGIAGTDDHDEMGVYVEPPQSVFGLREVDGHYIARTAREGERSYHGDTDLVLYSLRKYLALVATGNPTALIPLFAPPSAILHVEPAGELLRTVGVQLLSQRAGHRFLGYLQSQRERMVTGKRVPARPELIEKYGYDVKYASHAIRLGMQGIEVVERGTLTLPLPQAARDTVLAIKRGERELSYVLELIDSLAGRLADLLASGNSPLPESPDLDRAAEWSTDVHLRAWGLR